MKSYAFEASEGQGSPRYPGLDEFESGYISPNIKTLYTASDKSVHDEAFGNDDTAFWWGV